MKLLEDRVLIKEIPKSHPNLILASSEEATSKGTVILIGDFVSQVKPGDIVIYSRSAAIDFSQSSVYQETLHLVSEYDILAHVNQ